MSDKRTDKSYKAIHVGCDYCGSHPDNYVCTHHSESFRQRCEELEKENKKANSDRDYWCRLYNEQLNEVVKLKSKYEPETLDY